MNKPLTRLRAAVEDYDRNKDRYTTAAGVCEPPYYVKNNYHLAVRELFLAAKEVCKDV